MKHFNFNPFILITWNRHVVDWIDFFYAYVHLEAVVQTLALYSIPLSSCIAKSGLFYCSGMLDVCFGCIQSFESHETGTWWIELTIFQEYGSLESCGANHCTEQHALKLMYGEFFKWCQWYVWRQPFIWIICNGLVVELNGLFICLLFFICFLIFLQDLPSCLSLWRHYFTWLKGFCLGLQWDKLALSENNLFKLSFTSSFLILTAA